MVVDICLTPVFVHVSIIGDKENNVNTEIKIILRYRIIKSTQVNTKIPNP
jgi:hypothetical protein